jgi:hypothetical protein
MDGQTKAHPESFQIFIAYARKDKNLQRKVKEHLSPLEREGFRIWYDGMITPGQEWEAEVIHHLHSAEVILLLVSASFIASDYCYETEMRAAVERHHRGSALVIPIILRPVDWHSTPFAKLQALPEDARPVTTWPNRDKVLSDVSRGIRKAIKTWLSRMASSPLRTPIRSRLDLLRDLPTVPPLK